MKGINRNRCCCCCCFGRANRLTFFFSNFFFSVDDIGYSCNAISSWCEQGSSLQLSDGSLKKNSLNSWKKWLKYELIWNDDWILWQFDCGMHSISFNVLNNNFTLIFAFNNRWWLTPWNEWRQHALHANLTDFLRFFLSLFLISQWSVMLSRALNKSSRSTWLRRTIKRW